MGAGSPDSEIAELVKTNMSMAYHMAIKTFQRKFKDWGMEETGKKFLTLAVAVVMLSFSEGF